MIGNDIIDISRLAEHSRSRQLRFWQKILCEEEMESFLATDQPALAIWKFWALKESAYKCYFQQTRHRFFAPKEFRCQWKPANGDDQARIVTPVGTFYAKIQQTISYIHAHCSDSPERLEKGIFHLVYLPNQGPGDLSVQLRTKTLFQIAKKIKCLPGDLSWEDTAGFPRVFYREKLLPIRVSMSHHGEWGAMAFRPEMVPPA